MHRRGLRRPRRHGRRVPRPARGRRAPRRRQGAARGRRIAARPSAARVPPARPARAPGAGAHVRFRVSGGRTSVFRHGLGRRHPDLRRRRAQRRHARSGALRDAGLRPLRRPRLHPCPARAARRPQARQHRPRRQDAAADGFRPQRRGRHGRRGRRHRGRGRWRKRLRARTERHHRIPRTRAHPWRGVHARHRPLRPGLRPPRTDRRRAAVRGRARGGRAARAPARRDSDSWIRYSSRLRRMDRPAARQGAAAALPQRLRAARRRRRVSGASPRARDRDRHRPAAPALHSPPAGGSAPAPGPRAGGHRHATASGRGAGGQRQEPLSARGGGRHAGRRPAHSPRVLPCGRGIPSAAAAARPCGLARRRNDTDAGRARHVVPRRHRRRRGRTGRRTAGRRPAAADATRRGGSAVPPQRCRCPRGRRPASCRRIHPGVLCLSPRLGRGQRPCRTVAARRPGCRRGP